MEEENGLGRRRANQRPKPSTQRKQTTASRQATNDNDTAAIMAGDITDVVGVGRERELEGYEILSVLQMSCRRSQRDDGEPTKKQTNGKPFRKKGGEKKKTFNERYGTSTLLMGRKRLDISETYKNKANLLEEECNSRKVRNRYKVVSNRIVELCLNFLLSRVSILASAKDQRSRLLARTESTSE